MSPSSVERPVYPAGACITAYSSLSSAGLSSSYDLGGPSFLRAPAAATGAPPGLGSGYYSCELKLAGPLLSASSRSNAADGGDTCLLLSRETGTATAVRGSSCHSGERGARVPLIEETVPSYKAYSYSSTQSSPLEGLPSLGIETLPGGSPAINWPSDFCCPSAPRLRPQPAPKDLLLGGFGDSELLPRLRHEDQEEEGSSPFLGDGLFHEQFGGGPPPVRGLSQQLREALANWEV